MSPLRPVVALVLVAAVLAGCRFEVRTEVAVARDGSGTVALVTTFDEVLLAELDALDVDPTAELAAAVAAAPGWQLDRTTEEDGSLRVTTSYAATDPEELTAELAELTAGLSPDDPAMVVDLDLDVDRDGAASVDGSVQLRTPVGPGVVTDEAAADRLAALAAETVEAVLVVELPGAVRSSDADEVAGSQATWTIAPGPARPVTARAAAPGGPTREQMVVAAAALVVVSGALVTATWVRRRRRLSRAG